MPLIRQKHNEDKCIWKEKHDYKELLSFSKEELQESKKTARKQPTLKNMDGHGPAPLFFIKSRHKQN